MAELIERQGVINRLLKVCMTDNVYSMGIQRGVDHAISVVNEAPAVDAVEVVRCQHCIHSVPFERNCELNTTAYMHCKLGRGEETLNVWHKYKKYYRDYSVVDRDGFCDEGERIKQNEGKVTPPPAR